MANVDSPFGLKPIRHRNGAPYNGAANPYYVPSTYDTSLFVGEAVTKTGTANTAVFEGNGIGTLPEVNKTAAGDGNAITGVVVAAGVNRDSLYVAKHVNSTEGIVWVCDDPDVIFEIQADGAIPATSIGLNAVLIDTHAGSAITHLAGTELDTTSDAPEANASNQLTIQRAVNRTDNDTTITHAKVEVKINNHTESAGIIGI